LPHWLVARDVPLERVHGSSRAEMIQVPVGVNGVISPWNAPIGCPLAVAADILAAGNPVIIHPSELAPASAQMLAEAVASAFEPSVMAVVQGGPDLTLEFAGQPWGHLTFSGNAHVGRQVAEIAARTLVPVTLTLGGKSPALFAPDGVTPELVQRFLSFRTLKGGQMCASPDHVLVPRHQLDLFLGLAEGIWRTAYPTHVGHPDAVGMVNDQRYRRVLGYLDEARARGVAVVALNDDLPDPVRRQIPMTFVVDPPADLGCMTDEVLGPVVPIVLYDEFDEAIEWINAGPSPVAAYLATFDRSRVDQFVAQVRCGSVGINSFGLQTRHPALAFGGIGASGHGARSGREGFLNYSHTKTVFHGSADSVLHLALSMPLAELAGHVADRMLTDPADPNEPNDPAGIHGPDMLPNRSFDEPIAHGQGTN
ncbi:MAG: aldehyde dehydrogenase family protein, partial [Ilumatobacteraceae bacterium]